VTPAIAVHDPAPVRADESGQEHARMARAIRYIVDHFDQQPSLEEVAGVAAMSPFHFQRTFKRWAGVSPKRFLQYVTLGHARELLAGEASVLDAALDCGLSGPSRLHDLFVACEAMTPGEFKAMGGGLVVRYGLHDTPLGTMLLGATERGVCWLAFIDDDEDVVVAAFEEEWRGATLIPDQAATARLAASASILAPEAGRVPLHLKGTNFQIKVWEALLRIPFGQLVSYQDIARAIGQPKAVRAVGRAVGRNNVSWLIPCHRVILGTGVIHNYRWGVPVKRRLLAVEAAVSEARAAA
jgi:AraC family transcriptional regulator of adaptative response/methylated-DNA-[protein]-cysteine methyltransferase